MLCNKCKVREATPPFKRCDPCREQQAHYTREAKRRNPEAVRAKTRAAMARIRENPTPVQAAYLERAKPIRDACSRAWIARNPGRRNLTHRLNHAVAAGKLAKPSYCQDCGRAKKLVAWDVQEPSPGVFVVQAWLCWGDWWKRRRASSAGRPPAGPRRR